jgi:subtilisin family serine protease
MNGRTAISTRAATVAARVGMLVVNAAGNEGDDPWRFITAPADADSIISVGAVDSLGFHANFSSYGPTADGRVKPTLAAMGRASAVLNPSGGIFRGSGTSFACPILAGMAAGFWQANPTLTAQQVIAALRNTASQSNAPNTTLGYGIPNFVAAYNALNPTTPLASRPKTTLDQLALYPNPSSDSQLTLELPLELRNKPLQVRVLDAKGAVVTQLALAATAAPTASLQLPYLAKGAYVFEVTTGTLRRTAQFIKQ